MTSLRKKAAEEPVIKMVKAMGAENPVAGKDFIKVLDKLIVIVGCTDLKMSNIAITRKELKLYPQKIYEVLGGGIGGMQEVCGALAVAIATISFYSSEGTPGNGEKRKKVYDKVRRAAEIFQKEYGGITCQEILNGECPKAFQCGMKVKDAVLIIDKILADPLKVKRAEP